MKSILSILCFILPFCLLSKIAIAQNYEIQGIVIDKQSKEPLPFVQITYNNKKQGFTSDIDGKFKIKALSKIEFLKFDYIGYKPRIIQKEIIEKQHQLTVYLEEDTYNLNEVIIIPGENPAHRIIKKVLENRKLNDPDELESYSCKFYDKIYFTCDIDKSDKKTKVQEASTDSLKTDTVLQKINKFLDKQYFMMMESASERYYKKPGIVNEKVIASKVSGLKEPSVVLLATQLQSFSFYKEMITLFESRYVSPISTGSINRYFFQIEDTSYTSSGDTVFCILFRPKQNRNFEGLKGFLNINTNKYAIQNVIAEPVDDNGLINLKISQNYQIIDGHWFPVELNTEIIYGDLMRFKVGDHFIRPVGIGKSYLSDIKINAGVEKIKFDAIELKVEDNAYKQSDSVWAKFRHDSLSDKELRTYQIIDSLGKAKKFDLKMKIGTCLSSGYIPFHFIDINVINFFDYNEYEGSRHGFGFRTNEKVSNVFSVGAYSAYGINDKKWKYGANFNILLARKDEFIIGLNYKNDVIESSGYRFYDDKPAFNFSENYRDYMISDMTYNEEYEASISFRFLKKFKFNMFINQSLLRNTSSYRFLNNGDYDSEAQPYNLRKVGIGIKYSPNESLAYMVGDLYSLNSFPSPVFYFNLVRGFKDNLSGFDYLKIESKININFMTKAFGQTRLQLVAGKVFGDLPYFMLYNGHGSFVKFGVESANSFATMGINEFLSDEFVSVHYQQDFGSLLFKGERFKPKFIFTNSIGYGHLEKPELHQNLEFKTMEKGYFETGLLINDIIRIKKIVGFGFGIYYRYGPYSFSDISTNFAYKISLTLNF